MTISPEIQAYIKDNESGLEGQIHDAIATKASGLIDTNGIYADLVSSLPFGSFLVKHQPDFLKPLSKSISGVTDSIVTGITESGAYKGAMKEVGVVEDYMSSAWNSFMHIVQKWFNFESDHTKLGDALLTSQAKDHAAGLQQAFADTLNNALKGPGGENLPPPQIIAQAVAKALDKEVNGNLGSDMASSVGDSLLKKIGFGGVAPSTDEDAFALAAKIHSEVFTASLTHYLDKAAPSGATLTAEAKEKAVMQAVACAQEISGVSIHECQNGKADDIPHAGLLATLKENLAKIHTGASPTLSPIKLADVTEPGAPIVQKQPAGREVNSP